eukprot:TRINITY_DN1644_c0_g1_i1.p1 TRINITY_DN1644_c0_g1~~TRINITY_DN1644_c0_g1_i1.p1  ORF type:complete len:427 (-),score=96.63 TRINITY_DN1644_c0_g1_i1:49-1329(-)
MHDPLAAVVLSPQITKAEKKIDIISHISEILENTSIWPRNTIISVQIEPIKALLDSFRRYDYRTTTSICLNMINENFFTDVDPLLRIIVLYCGAVSCVKLQRIEGFTQIMDFYGSPFEEKNTFQGNTNTYKNLFGYISPLIMFVLWAKSPLLKLENHSKETKNIAVHLVFKRLSKVLSIFLTYLHRKNISTENSKKSHCTSLDFWKTSPFQVLNDIPFQTGDESYQYGDFFSDEFYISTVLYLREQISAFSIFVNRYKLGINQLIQCLEISANPIYFDYLGRIYYHMGNLTEAQRYWQIFAGTKTKLNEILCASLEARNLTNSALIAFAKKDLAAAISDFTLAAEYNVVEALQGLCTVGMLKTKSLETLDLCLDVLEKYPHNIPISLMNEIHSLFETRGFYHVEYAQNALVSLFKKIAPEAQLFEI